jgi:HAD superfamily hydrolase (TIGR01549 family)
LISSNPIKSILFDLDGTLRHHLPNGGEFFVQYARNIGLPISEEDHIRAEHWEHLYFANSAEIKADGKIFKDNLKGFWVNFTKRHLVALGMGTQLARELAPQASAYMAEFYKPEVHVPKEARPLLEFLKRSGYVLGMVSNRDKPYLEELKKLEIDSYFQFTLSGAEAGSYKPDALIFEHALKLAGTSAQETMYIGDNYFADIVGSRRAGLIPVLYDPISLFPDVECAVIRSFDKLPALLN